MINFYNLNLAFHRGVSVLWRNMRTRVFYLFDTEKKVNISKFDNLTELQSEKRKLNTKEGKDRYVTNSSWVINKLQ